MPTAPTNLALGPEKYAVYLKNSDRELALYRVQSIEPSSRGNLENDHELGTYDPVGTSSDPKEPRRPLTYEIGGFWRRNMMMRDRETGSVWQQATGEAVAGPLCGARLEPIGGQQTTWAAWLKEHPRSTLAVKPSGAPQGIIRLLPYQKMFDLFGRVSFTFPGLHPNDTRLASREEVAGITIGTQSRAYPLSVLRQPRLVHDQLGGKSIEVAYEPEGDRVWAVEHAIDGPNRAIEVARMWWLAWSEFHPETSIYRPERR